MIYQWFTSLIDLIWLFSDLCTPPTTVTTLGDIAALLRQENKHSEEALIIDQWQKFSEKFIKIRLLAEKEADDDWKSEARNGQKAT